MDNNYTQFFVQIVFPLQGRENVIKEKFRDKLEKYTCGIVNNNKSKPFVIYRNPENILLV